MLELAGIGAAGAPVSGPGERPRVCFVAPMMGAGGGVPNPAETMAPHLEGRGYDLVLTSGRSSGVGRLIEMCTTLVRERRRLDVVVISVFSGRAFAWCRATSWLAGLLRLPVILVLHGGRLPAFRTDHPRTVDRVLRRAQTVVVPSPFLGRMAAAAGVAHVVVPNPVDLPPGIYRFRDRVQPRLFWMRSFAPEYDPVLAVDVISRLRASGIRASLDLAGKDYGLEPEVRARIEAEGLGDQVRIVGFLDAPEKATAFADHDIYLHTNRVDNTPVSVLEALAAGLPVVATTAGGLPDLLTDGETGVLVPPGDGEAMAVAVRRLLDDERLAAHLSHTGRALADACRVESVAEAWDQVLAPFVPGGAPAR